METQDHQDLLDPWEEEVCPVFKEKKERLVAMEKLVLLVLQDLQEKEDWQECPEYPDLKDTEASLDLMELRVTEEDQEKKAKMEVLVQWVLPVLLVQLALEEKEDAMDHLASLESEELTELWVHQENQVPLVSLVVPGFQEFLVPKETLELMDLREALAYKVPEEKLANLACLVNLVKWVLLAKMVQTEKRVALVCQEHLVLQAFLDQEDNQV